MTSTPTYHLVRQAVAAKLGANSTGSIHYAVLIDADHTEPSIALIANDGGGYFSREALPISALRRCSEQASHDKPLNASSFKAAFIGRSTNNGYFIVAALCAEGLLTRAERDGPGRGQPLADAGLWDDWSKQVLAEVSEKHDALPVFHAGKQSARATEADTDAVTHQALAEEAGENDNEAATAEETADTGDGQTGAGKRRRKSKATSGD